MVRVGILVLFQILGGKQSAKKLTFTIEYYVGCEFVINSFYSVELCFLYTHFGKSFFFNLFLIFITNVVGSLVYANNHAVLTFRSVKNTQQFPKGYICDMVFISEKHK